MRVTLVAASHVKVQVACTSCQRPVELECEGLGGVLELSHSQRVLLSLLPQAQSRPHARRDCVRA